MPYRGEIGIVLRAYFERRARTRVLSHSVLAKIVQMSTPSTGAQFTDYWTLYSYIRKYKPKEVLELGPGVTTLIIAQALKENGFGRVTAMEDVAKYYEATRKTIPNDLSMFIDLRLSPSGDYRYGPFVGISYKDIPHRPYDFVLVDGPNYDAKTQFDADLIEVIKRSSHPVSAFVDSRTGSCFVYSLLLGKKFRFNYIVRSGFIDGATKEDLRDYNKIVASFMKGHGFARWWGVLRFLL